MIQHEDMQIAPAARATPSRRSPVASERIRMLARRIIEGAPALTVGEMRELAEAIVEHNAVSDAETGARH